MPNSISTHTGGFPMVMAPNYTQIPNIFIDYWMHVLSPAQFKVLICISRKTFGWNKSKDKISLRQIISLTSLSKKGVIECLKVLEGNNLITILKAKTDKGDFATNQYEINVIEEQGVVNSVHNGGELDKQPVVYSGNNGVVYSGDIQKKDITKEKHTKETPLNPLKGRAAKAACVSDDTSYVKYFGSFVRLKEGELESLNEKYGKKLVDEIIDEMNDWCASSKPKGYLDYAAAIRQWIRRRKQAPTGNYRGPQVDRRTKNIDGSPVDSPYDGMF